MLLLYWKIHLRLSVNSRLAFQGFASARLQTLINLWIVIEEVHIMIWVKVDLIGILEWQQEI